MAMVWMERKHKRRVQARSARGGLPERLSHSARQEPEGQKSDPLAGTPVCPRRPSLALCRPHPAPHSPPHKISADGSTNQPTQRTIRAASKSRMSFTPGIGGQSKSGASERSGREEERAGETALHLAASCSALRLIVEASCTLCAHSLTFGWFCN